MASHSEFDRIRAIKKIVGKNASGVFVGIGDDTAVLAPPKKKLLATVDMMVENVHFDLSYTTASELGYKALAVNLSDIAAMGGIPRYALVSLGLPSELRDDFVEDLYRGMKSLAKKFKVEIVGGNLSRCANVVVDVFLLGEAKQPITRTGAKTGDWIAVTGTLGDSAAGLACLKTLGKNSEVEFEPLIHRHLTPLPRLRESQALAKTGALSSMIDISDGLAAELHHLAESSGVGLRVREKEIPFSSEALKAAKRLGKSPLEWALYGGEDYELLFTFPQKFLSKLKAKARFKVIGEILPKRAGIKMEGIDGKEAALPKRGWDHFGS